MGTIEQAQKLIDDEKQLQLLLTIKGVLLDLELSRKHVEKEKVRMDELVVTLSQITIENMDRYINYYHDAKNPDTVKRSRGYF